jgi:hypothetical protein
MSYRLFISHSSHTPQARQRLDDLAGALEAAAATAGAAVKVIYDAEQIERSDDWRQRIAFMLHAAHGGVVLLDDAALASRWVCVEASFLAMRQAVDPDRFRIFPVSFLAEAALSGLFDGRPPRPRRPTRRRRWCSPSSGPCGRTSERRSRTSATSATLTSSPPVARWRSPSSTSRPAR